MCGIAGWLGAGPAPDRAISMLAGLRHRGPDQEATSPPGVGVLMCARLRVMDPRPEAQQPFWGEAGTVSAVCNGELYNFGALAAELTRRGHQLRTRCDAEVVPHLYEEHGPDFVGHLRGMFGVAVLDHTERRLILARDRWGVKPLYYTLASGPAGESLIFASELGALLASGIQARVDRQALIDYTALGFIPAPETFIEHVYALEPGELLDASISNGRVTWRRAAYHRWTIAVDQSVTLADAVATTDALLGASVSAQGVADVPMGIFLSGGIDSSLIAAARAETAPGTPTFSMRFADSGYDESWAAALAAKHLGLPHTVVDLPPALSSYEHIAGVLRRVGQPFSDTSIFAVHALAIRVRSAVTVCLGGEGGDEAFGGYELFRDLAIAADDEHPDPTGLHAVERHHRLLDAATHRALCGADTGAPVSRFFEPSWEYVWDGRPTAGERRVAYATEASTRVTLANDYLVKVDLATMAHGLELRVPMLDEDLFSFALTLPSALKTSAAEMKLVLRKLAARRLPPAVATKPKWGFSVPPHEWLTGQARADIVATLRAADASVADHLDPRVYRPWVDAFAAVRDIDGVHELELFDRVILLLALEVHLRDLAARRDDGLVPMPM